MSENFTVMFTLSDSAWTDIKLPWDIVSWSFWCEGAIYRRGRLPGAIVLLDAGAVVDNLDGTVTVAAAAHGLTDGDDFIIPGNEKAGDAQPANYQGMFLVLAAGDANNLVFTKTYVAETILAGAYAKGYKDIKYLSGFDHAEDQGASAREVLFKAKAVTGTAYLHVSAMRG